MSITKIGHKTKFICHDHIIYQNFVVKLTFWTRYQQGWWNNILPGARLMPQEVQSTCNRLITCKVYASKCANVIKYGDSRTCIFLLNTCTDFTTHIVNLQDGNIDRLHNFFQFASCNSNSFYILWFFFNLNAEYHIHICIFGQHAIHICWYASFFNILSCWKF